MHFTQEGDEGERDEVQKADHVQNPTASLVRMYSKSLTFLGTALEVKTETGSDHSVSGSRAVDKNFVSARNAP